ncbi:hypothetical protein VP1G_05161 [Cytospora mali]|uniref:Uncharacterized protein n=1 Tax=Cytospora mali TaxID=578113 RepID=A0A194V1Q7_CYTMA|nr:hypothetical protein VP1G_05161 [Valsa mali var. pyri (nom. inval.)]
MMAHGALLRILFLVAFLLTTSLAQTRKTVADFIPAVLNNSNHTPDRWKTAFGGQNFTWCCVQAVADSLTVNDANDLVAVDNPPIIGLNISVLQQATDAGQFPCTATYESNEPDGAPEINVPYTWLVQTCPGWELSSGENLNGWLQPLSGFLLPAVIFCLSVPRRRKFHVFRAFFVADLAGVKSYIPAFLGAIGAMLLVTIDTIVWLSICWALSGPMILSGLYEALLDNRIIDFVKVKMQNRNLTLDMRCRLLMLVLIGNLDLALEDNPFSDDTAQSRRRPPVLPVIQGTSPLSGDSLLSRQRSGTLDSDILSQPLMPGGKRTSSEVPRLDKPPFFEVPLEHLSRNLGSEGDVGEIRQRQMSSHPDYLGISPAGSTVRENNSMDQALPHPVYQEYSQQRTPDIRVNQTSAVIMRKPTGHLRASPWRHMEELLYPIRLYDDEDTDRHLSPRQYPKHYHRNILCHNNVCEDTTHFDIEEPHPRTAKIERQILKTKTRLRTMLSCQYSFGSMVGAPVVFFLGGFVFALLQSIQSIGDEDTALALAFGQWYMTVPHIAIISGLLLAGNNPNILEGVFATQHQGGGEDIKILGLNWGLAYPSCYKVAWQWHRGYNKLLWIHTLLDRYGQPIGVDRSYVERYEQENNLHDLEELHDKTTLSALDWFLILVMAGFLLGVPFVLAFITAFYTPEVGLSCRSFTFTMYACAELGQVVLWLWAYAVPPCKTRHLKEPPKSFGPFAFFRSGGWLHRHGFYNPNHVGHFLPPNARPTPRAIWQGIRSDEFRDIRSIWCCIWYSLYIFFGAVATLAALGGTLMQLLGVYSADICNLRMDQWIHRYTNGATAMLSVNTTLMIRDAQKYWKPCAITAIAFMTFVSFVGWWYQRRMKDLFTTLVSEVDLDKYDRVDANASKRSYTPQPQTEAQFRNQRNLWGSFGA